MKKNLKGQVFGRLTVLEENGRTSDNRILWKCQCACGNICNVSSKLLLNGHTKSCGCLNKEKQIQRGKNSAKDLTNYRSGKLIALSPTDKRTKSGEIYWLCQCDCGNTSIVSSSNLISKNTQSCGCTSQSHGEIKIEELLIKNNIHYIKEYRDINCKLSTGGFAKFDFFIENKYYIEYDGDLHFFSRNNGWNDEEHLRITQKRDSEKNEYCIKNNIPLIRIPYTHYKDLCIEDLLLQTSNFIYKVEERK